LRSDEAVVGIACRVASFCQSGFVASLLELQIQDPVPVLLLFTVHPLCLERCFDRQRLHNPQKLARNGSICSATIRMVAGDNQDGYLRHRLKA
jgi:hypothetical protein